MHRTFIRLVSFTIGLSFLGIGPVRLQAAERSLSPTVVLCQQMHLPVYQQTITAAFNTYQNSLMSEWQRQVDFRLRAAKTAAIRATRTRVLAANSTSLQRLLTQTKTQQNNDLRADVATLTRLIENEAESGRVLAWVKQVPSFTNLNRTLNTLQVRLLGYASTNDKPIITRVWASQRATFLATFISARTAARQDLVTSLESCVQDANGSEENNDVMMEEADISSTNVPATTTMRTLDPNDNSDASHPELDITRPENQNQTAFNRIADDPRTRSAYYGDYGPTSTVTGLVGMMRGCVGVFAQTNTPQRGTLIKGSASSVYYYASNGKRYVFPSALELQSWYGAVTPMAGLAQLTDTRPCRAVVQVPDSMLASIQLGGNVTVRPNAYVLSTDARRPSGERILYIVERSHTLRPIVLSPGEDQTQFINQLYPLQGDGEVFSIPEALFRQDYTVGSSFTRTSTLSTGSPTIEQELGL